MLNGCEDQADSRGSHWMGAGTTLGPSHELLMLEMYPQEMEDSSSVDT